MKKLKGFLFMALGILLLTGCSMKYETDMNISGDGKMEFSIIAGYDKEFITSMMSLQDSFGEGEGTLTEDDIETGEGVEIVDSNLPSGGDSTTTTEPKEYTDAEIQEFLYSSIENEEEVKAEAASKGFTVERYAENGFYGYKYTANISHIDTVSSDTEVKFDLSKIMDDTNTTPITSEKMFRKQGNVYYATFTFDPSNTSLNTDEYTGGDTTDAETQAQIEQYLSALTFDFKYVVTLPNAAVDSNATEKSEDGKTLTWTLGSSQVTNINFTFELGEAEKPITGVPESGGFQITQEMIIGAVAVILVLALIIYVVVSKNKKKKAANVEGTTAEVAPATNESVAPAHTGEVSAMVNSVPAANIEATPSPAPETPVVTPAVETPAVAPSVAPTEPVATNEVPAQAPTDNTNTPAA